ncbi:MAG: GAF domain-containing protein [Meiothermus sp.]|uniref:GAF domain-containing protein n=1 Tax=Meiothermus sp. TaxID=1955249 RepID=UPI0025CD81FC|nr:GAF domain-containing protein [Meiothermus sp.]MCS7067688.1 GAF domain-containing protein [Meiothermus sp.]MDW8424909.1 GAF domain-containing protein [Meiothermus sp.]
MSDFLHRLDSKALAGFLEATRDAILIASVQGRLEYANRAAQDLLGYSLEELQARDILDWIAPPYREWVAERIRQNRIDPPGIFEIALVRKDGSWRYVRYSFLYLEIEGQMYGAAIAHDLTETRQTLRRLEALYQADEKLYASLELDEVLQALADVCVDLLGADKSCILIWDETHQHLITRAQRGFTSPFVRVMNEYAGHGLLAYAAQSGETVVVQDTHQDERVARHVTDPEGIRAFMHIPIRLDGEVFGVFSVNNLRPHSLGPDEQRAFTSLARRAAVAIRNARLYAQAQGQAALEERQKLARNLHDSVSQAIYGIVLGVRTAKTQLARNPEQAPAALDFVLNLAEGAMAEMRALIFELRPESLRQEGLVAALSKQAAALRARHGLSLEADLGPEPALGLEAKEALYRVAQEALHNIVKHAKARKVHLGLHQENGTVRLEVRDDGVGFDSQRAYPGHLGLVSMRERLERLGGRCWIESCPGAGTTVRAVLPLENPAA